MPERIYGRPNGESPPPDPEDRAAMYAWFLAHFDLLKARLMTIADDFDSDPVQVIVQPSAAGIHASRSGAGQYPVLNTRRPLFFPASCAIWASPQAFLSCPDKGNALHAALYHIFFSLSSYHPQIPLHVPPVFLT